MTARHLKSMLLALFACVLLTQLKASPLIKPVPLKNALKQVTKTYGTQFVYDPHFIDGKTTVYNIKANSKKPVEDVLKSILYPNELVFLYISSNYYSIVPKDQLGKATSARSNSLHPPITTGITTAINTKQINVSGTVKDVNGTPLASATVNEKGTNNTTITDQNGVFNISVTSSEAVLVFSSVGFNNVEVTVGSQTNFEIELKRSNSTLGEVVVVGYGTQRKSDLTGSVASVNNKELMQRPAINAEQALAGKVAGVNVATNSGRPGGRTRVSIRGFSSINATNVPLYVVDGIESPNGIDNIDPNNIESISVLKDASSTAIYGTRGANGVIIVTTKRGRKNSSQISYDSYVGINWLPKELDALNSQGFLKIEEEQYKNAAKFDSVGFANGKYKDPLKKRMNYLVGNTLGNHELFKLDANGIPQPIYDIDWQKMATRTAISNNHNLSVTGGDKLTNYGLFLGYVQDNGIIKGSSAQRYNIRAVLDRQVKDWLKVGGTFAYSSMNQKGVNDNNGSYDVMRYMIEFVPFIPYKYNDGTYSNSGDYEGLERVDNPLTQINEIKRVYNTHTFTGNTYLNFKLIQGLELTSTLGVNVSNENDPFFQSSKLVSNKSQASISSSETKFWEWSNRLNYIKQLNADNRIDVLAGAELQEDTYLGWTARTERLSDDYYQWYNLSAGATALAPSSGSTSYQMQSYFGRVNYSFKDKYLVTLTGRDDGSSRFGANNKFAFFPSGAVAWKISQEDFLKQSKAISNLKLRTSYGLTGNSAIGSYRSLATLSTSTYIFNDTRASGSQIGTLANPNLKWEKTAQLDIGLDLGLYNNRINLVADFYSKQTRDLLLDAPVPSSSGYTTVTRNIGSMENKGFELSLNTVNIDHKNLTWTTNFNISTLKNRVTALGAKNEDIIYGFKDLLLLRVGQSVGSFYGYIRDGIWGTKDAQKAATYGQLPGDLRIRDLNNDGVINGNDRAIIGKGIPDFFGTFSNTVRYKNFDLTLELQYMSGNDVFDNSRNSGEARQGIANSYASVLNAWTPDNQDAVLEQVRPTGAGYAYYMDTRKLQDGSFIRGKNLLLGYTLPASLQHRWGLNNLRVYASFQNFFIITNYEGYDPEVSNYDNDVFSQGVNYASYPKPRTLMLGLNVSF